MSYPSREETKIGAAWFFWAVGLFLLAAVVLIPAGWVLGWFATPFRITSPQNVERQFDHLYTNYRALQATAGNVCSAEVLVASAPDPVTRNQRESQAEAQRQNYRRMAADYTQAYDNVFKAGAVGPPDLPRQAPSLDVAKRAVGC